MDAEESPESVDLGILGNLWKSRKIIFHQRHGRILHLCQITDEVLASKLIRENGFQLFRWGENTITLRFPEKNLFDISNPKLTDGRGTELKDYLELSKEFLIECGSDIVEIEGKHTDVVTRICGPDMTLLEAGHEAFKSFLKDRGYFVSKVHMPKEKNLNKGASDFFDGLRSGYKTHFGDAAFKWSPLNNSPNSSMDLPFWEWVSETGMDVGFILHGGLAILRDYLSKSPEDLGRIRLFEMHLENDPYAFLRRKNTLDWMYPRTEDPNEILIIDKSFSGGTLLKAKNTLKGNHKSLALFPKSLEGVQTADFFYFAGRLFDSKTLNGLNLSSDWVSEILSCEEVLV
ncbi:MAG: hypothetical protein GOU98_03790 [Candidatus Altiarchaeota archaeon]|nr:hypothetical protein [Candidatus Altiarchaeota archaeon]